MSDASSSNAASYGPSMTDWEAPGQVLQLQKFNPLLGTLTAVTFSWDGRLDTVFTVENETDERSPVTYSASGSMQFSIPHYGLASLVFGPQSGQFDVDAGTSSALAISLKDSGTGSTTNLTDFIGPGSFAVLVTARSDSAMSTDNDDIFLSTRTNAFASAQVSYDYIAATHAVPEPGALALLGLALGAACLATRRRA